MKPDLSLKGFSTRVNELSTEHGCVLRGTKGCHLFQDEGECPRKIYSVHQRIVKTKPFARKCVWCPGIESDVERVCRECEICQLDKIMPPQVPLHLREFPGEPWKRLHIDFAGPFMSAMFMTAVDAHTKWLEVFQMPQITT